MQCLICGNLDLNVIKTIDQTNIYECDKCRLAITEKQKIKQDLDKYYGKTDYLKRLPTLTKRYLKFYKLIGKYKQSGLVLDVGAGFGLLSNLLSKNKFYMVTSVEPFINPYLIKNKNTNIVKETAEDFFSNNKQLFDVILLIDVLEHFNKPDSILGNINKSLNKNGIVIIQIPNYKSLMARLCSNWAWWFVEDHKYHFSPKSIRLLTNNEGFDLIHMTSSESYHDFIANLHDNFVNIQNKYLRRLTKVIFLSIFSLLYAIFSRTIWSLGYGGVLLLVLKKSNNT